MDHAEKQVVDRSSTTAFLPVASCLALEASLVPSASLCVPVANNA
jgi:hypothetical protein